jgi:hypothetical protein
MTLDSTARIGVQGSIFAKFEKNGFSEKGNRPKVVKMHTLNTANFSHNKCWVRSLHDRNNHAFCNCNGDNCVG